ncbi:MAG: histidine--tRNA ligase [Planctomycetes bacterium]|nr:histidine--tRNA ligase [Planctomycetota bacterium]
MLASLLTLASRFPNFMMRSRMSNDISTKPPSGMRDFLAPDVARRRHVIAVVQRVYESFGFVPLETPTIENLTTLLGKYGPEGDQLLYRLLHRREKLQRALEASADERGLADEGLRYDLTVPLARVVANYKDLPTFYKRYQIQPVWRADRPARGRFREFYQCDVDVMGTQSLVAEAEVCGAVATVLRELGFADFRIHVNHRELLRAFVAGAGIDLANESLALIALDKLDKVGRDGVLEELGQKGIEPAAGERLLDNLAAAREPGAFERLEGAESLRELFAIAANGPAADHLVFDPTLARGLSYYTGPIFEITCEGLAGSLGGGGRYDDLIGMFGKQKVPAVGFSLGLERVLLVMEERSMFPDLGVGPEVLLCRMKEVAAGDAVRIATALRERGVRVEVFADAPQLKKQLQYANGLGCPYAAVLGENELRAGTIALKNLTSGEQVVVTVDGAVERIRSRA